MPRLSLRKCLLLVYLVLHNDCATRVHGGPADKSRFPCGQYRCGGDRVEQPCGCDELCEVYGDCCPDYTGVPHQGEKEQSDLNGEHRSRNKQTDPSDGHHGKTGQSDLNHGHQDAPPGTDHQNSQSDASNAREETAEVQSSDDSTSLVSSSSDDSTSLVSSSSDDSTSLVSSSPVITCMDTGLGSDYLLVSKCPADWTDEYVLEVCESHWYGISQVYILPVTSKTSRLSYKNMFCAFCNGQELRDVKFWSFSHMCGDDHRFMDIIANYLSDNDNCGIQFNEPTRRECVENVKDCTSTRSIRHINKTDNYAMVKQMCDKYVDYVRLTRVSDEYYKNAYCVQCEGKNARKGPFCGDSWNDIKEDNEMTKGQGKVRSLSSLAFIRNAKQDNTQSHPFFEEEGSCEKGGVYYRGSCVEVQCPTGFLLSKDMPQDCVVYPNAVYIVSVCYGWRSHADGDTNLPNNFKQYGLKYYPHDRTRECDGYGRDRSYYLMFDIRDRNFSAVLSLFDTNNYEKLTMSERKIYEKYTTKSERCETFTQAGSMDGNLAQILAFIEGIERNDSFPWMASISVTRDINGGTYQIHATHCTTPRFCTTVSAIPLQKLVANDTFKAGMYRFTFVCREVAMSRIRTERRNRNTKLLEFLAVMSEDLPNEGSVKIGWVILSAISVVITLA